MKFYTARSTKSNKQTAIKNGVGLMIVDHWTDPRDYPYFAIDNGCYSAYARRVRWDPSPFLHSLEKATELGLTPDFAVLPDIVAGGIESAHKSILWRNVLVEEYPKIPFYFAVQNGMTPDNIPQIGISGIFVGGTKEWKLLTIPIWRKYAQDKGIGIHVGRMGSFDDMIYCAKHEINSIDSTTWVQRNGTLEKRMQEFQEWKNALT